MHAAIFSDVHGNLPALEAFVKDTKKWADKYICLGDVVNYGPWGNECVEMVLSLPGIVLLEGNHERLFLGAEAIEHEIPLVQEFFRHASALFTRHDLIRNLPQSVEIGNYLCTHTIEGRRLYPDSEIVVSRSFFVGHSHHACRIASGSHAVINVGSVGQNRRHGDRINYVLYDVEAGDVQLVETPYEWKRMIEGLRGAAFPESCIEYYLKKMPGGDGRPYERQG